MNDNKKENEDNGDRKRETLAPKSPQPVQQHQKVILTANQILDLVQDLSESENNNNEPVVDVDLLVLDPRPAMEDLKNRSYDCKKEKTDNVIDCDVNDNSTNNNHSDNLAGESPPQILKTSGTRVDHVGPPKNPREDKESGNDYDEELLHDEPSSSSDERQTTTTMAPTAIATTSLQPYETRMMLSRPGATRIRGPDAV